MTGVILIVIGVVALFAAIVGGGLKIRDIEVGSVPSKWRQGMLALFGIFVAFLGLLIWADGDGTEPVSNTAAPIINAPAETVSADAPDTNTADTNTADTNAADTNAADIPADDPNQTAPVGENTPSE